MGAVWWILLAAPVFSASGALTSYNIARDTTVSAHKVNIKGYLQVRYHGLFQTNEELRCQQCDRSWGAPASFSLRRARIVFSGSINDRVRFYVAPDIASSVSASGMNYAQLRDAYFDVALTSEWDWRLRVGLSKIPYSFENLQSSSKRLSLDRHDGTNSAISNERDMGAFVYWTPAFAREIYDEISESGLKGTGDYGLLAFGLYNGQGGNESDLNDALHVAARLNYPFKVVNRVMEVGISGFTGSYSMISNDLSGLASLKPSNNYNDSRVAVSLVSHPSPIGFQVEYNWGVGPEYNPATNHIENQSLQGGYFLLDALTTIKGKSLIPFVVAHNYEGGKKFETDARSYRVRELEFGLEWHPIDNVEFTGVYTISSRRFEDATRPINDQKGSLLRLQAQVSF